MTAPKVQDPDAAPAPRSSVFDRRWTSADLALLDQGPDNTIPAFTHEVAARITGHDLWDMWPIEYPDGRLPRFDGASLWMVLTAPAAADPDARHAVARIHLLSGKDGVWTLHGPVFPEGFTPGSREWSGSAVLDAAGSSLTVFFTAAGRCGLSSPSFEQRLFQASCRFAHTDGAFNLSHWSALAESIVADGQHYLPANQTEGRAGEILGFRDPAWFRDPATGRAYLFFTGSSARAASRWTGVIGVAEADPAGSWRLRRPVIDASGLNNELERPHMRCVAGRYYLFWSTQAKVFADDAPPAPSGLYGAVAPSPLGPFTLLNGSGLVAATPAEAPAQEYSWWVLDDLSVIGFADYPGLADPAILEDATQRRAHFAGYPAPFFRIELDGASARVER
ncbi:glycoside hydrolase family 68 protein [Novosphingobium sp.]|uniref:glycoside hydrolase family 68 protein n=1 Tax=Novosphingobium sp. TaxID=1874826 RepID=UPI002632E711|nr:glycoside hydrolase family 68 protein [Novosphingobium sp.]